MNDSSKIEKIKKEEVARMNALSSSFAAARHSE